MSLHMHFTGSLSTGLQQSSPGTQRHASNSNPKSHQMIFSNIERFHTIFNALIVRCYLPIVSCSDVCIQHKTQAPGPHPSAASICKPCAQKQRHRCSKQHLCCKFCPRGSNIYETASSVTDVFQCTLHSVCCREVEARSSCSSLIFPPDFEYLAFSIMV